MSPSKPQTSQTWTATLAAIVDALKAVAGDQPQGRASFAKGRCVRGTYVPSDRAEEITRSRSFTRPSRVLARFSIGSNNLNVANTDNFALRGFSFRLGDTHHRSDILTQSAPVHFAKTFEQMLAFLKARVPGPDGKPDIERIRAFSATNPETLHQASYIAAHPLPRNFAGTTYWGVHSFPATNCAGETRFIKFKVAPVGADAAPAKNDVTANILDDDLEHRVTSGDVRFSVMALLDRPGDPTTDVTIRWPGEDDREEVRLGTIVITGLEPDETCDVSVFDPANLAEGIAHPPDEIFAARSAAYAISLAKRR
ncbi:catalase [Bradyrhizobium guangzhouense]|uniref:catalase n=1 Tax=Bradyrhizobium guangzhouense TaxID=1325095 RepID=A0ABY0E4T9_9BRAD|nr:catalase [Bradyrhizobium guangzhouense]RXH11853.1 catalase [Bradyrhizobium guangzhouense]